MESIWSSVVFAFLPRVPVLLAFVVALVMGFGRQQQLGSAMPLLVAGCLIEILLWFASFAMMYLQLNAASSGGSDVTGMYGVIYGAMGLLGAVSTILVLLAVFVGRQR